MLAQLRSVFQRLFRKVISSVPFRIAKLYGNAVVIRAFPVPFPAAALGTGRIFPAAHRPCHAVLWYALHHAAIIHKEMRRSLYNTALEIPCVCRRRVPVVACVMDYQIFHIGQFPLPAEIPLVRKRNSHFHAFSSLIAASPLLGNNRP